MKGRLLIVFHSNHGYVQRYVDILGNELGCDAVPANKFRGDMMTDYDKLLYIGSVKNDEINGFKKFSDYLDIAYKKLIVCGVGLMPFRDYIPDRIKDATISVTYEKFIPVFYAQGGFDVKELSRFEKFAYAWKLKTIRLSNIVSDDDKIMLNAAETPIDEVCKENIQPLLDYLEGREVDDKLYSPPEITDPEEEKQFFEELEKAAKAPDNKERALKKKLKKGVSKRSYEPNDSADVSPAPAEETHAAEPSEEGAQDTAPAEEEAARADETETPVAAENGDGE